MNGRVEPEMPRTALKPGQSRAPETGQPLMNSIAPACLIRPGLNTLNESRTSSIRACAASSHSVASPEARPRVGSPISLLSLPRTRIADAYGTCITTSLMGYESIPQWRDEMIFTIGHAADLGLHDAADASLLG